MILLPRDELRLRGVHPILVAIVRRAREIEPFFVVEGVRSLAQQAIYLAQGKSKTLNSKHLTGHAVDLCYWSDNDQDRVVDANEIDWNKAGRVAAAMKQAAFEMNVLITWGGDWATFRDGPHFEIDPKRFPHP